MIDRDIVATMLSADPAGLANAYDAYAGKLHAYCWTMLRDHDAAADAVQDTFIVADKCIGQLRDPDRLRPWLYAIARNECLRQLRASARSAPFEEAGDVIDESAGDVGRELDQEETRSLVWDAARGLNEGEYEVLELNLRHELEGADLAAALGVSRNHAHALLSRARAQFEVSLAALLVARTGRGSCETLDGLLTDWDGGITALLRKRINRHIEQCEVCGERKRRELRPAMLMSSLPFMVAPPVLRDKILRLVADPTASAYHQMVVNRAGPFGPDGFVQPLDHAGSGANSNNQNNNQGGSQGGQGSGQSGQGGGGGGPGDAPGSGSWPAPDADPGPGPGPAVAAAEWLPPWSPPEAWPDMLPADDDALRDRRAKKRGSLVALVIVFLLLIVAGALFYAKTSSAPAASGTVTAPPATALSTFVATAVPSGVGSDATVVTVTAAATDTSSPTAAPTTPRAPIRTTTRPVAPTTTRSAPSQPPTQTTAPLGTLGGPATYQFPYSANGGYPTGSFRVTENGGTLSGVRVSVSNPKVLQAAPGDIVRNTVVIDLTAETIYSNPVTVTVSAANATPVTVTVSWSTLIQ
ncbi:MAG TPA: sigma-70 family RNA polymerase sigma factor [Actinocrinis sp.]|nr:sigma-70 family RNA polymerase sigma factor [Actinocrinis sp.]